MPIRCEGPALPIPILFVVQETAHFGALCPIAERLLASGRYAPVFMFHTVYAAMSADIAACAEHGFTAVSTWGRASRARTSALGRTCESLRDMSRTVAALPRLVGGTLAGLARSLRGGLQSLVTGSWRRATGAFVQGTRAIGHGLQSVGDQTMRIARGASCRTTRSIAGGLRLLGAQSTRIARGGLRRTRQSIGRLRRSLGEASATIGRCAIHPLRGTLMPAVDRWSWPLRKLTAAVAHRFAVGGGTAASSSGPPRRWSRRWLDRAVRSAIRERATRAGRLSVRLARRVTAATRRRSTMLVRPVRALSRRLTAIAGRTARSGSRFARVPRLLPRVRRAVTHRLSRGLGTVRGGLSRAWRGPVGRGLATVARWPLQAVALPLLGLAKVGRAGWRGVRAMPAAAGRTCAAIRRRVDVDGLLSAVAHYAEFRNLVRDVCEDHEVGGIVLAEDNVGHGGGAVTWVARQRGIPTFVFPYTVANASEFAESYFDVPEHQLDIWPNTWVARLLPAWVHEHRGRRLLRLPGWRAVAQQLLGLAPPRPWAFNSGHADAIVVENDILVDYYRRQGLDREPLRAAGSMFDDRLAATLADAGPLRARYYARFGLPADRPMLLTAIPPDQLPSRPDCDFRDYGELVRAWLEPLRWTDFNVVVCLHPRLRREDFAFAEELGFHIAEEHTSDLVPLCDLYVASVSATIRWAVAAGKPVVNYDVYRYRYDDFTTAAGVRTIEEYDEYTALVDSLTFGPFVLADLKRRQEACMERWGRLDGRAGERILALVDDLVGPTAAGTPRDLSPPAPPTRQFDASTRSAA